MIKIENDIKRLYNDILTNLGHKVFKKYKYIRYIVTIIYTIFIFLIAFAKINFGIQFVLYSLLILSLFFTMQQMQRKTLQSYGFKRMRDYIKYELRKTLIQRKLFHSQLLKPIISSLDNKATIKYNPALLISFLFFIFNPFWSYFINKQLDKHIDLSKITISILLPALLILIFFFAPWIIYKVLMRTNKDLLSVLNELLYETIFKEINKSNYFYTSSAFRKDNSKD